jgi:hypothetical protein
MARLSTPVLLVLALGCGGKKSNSTPANASDLTIPKVDPTLCDTNGKNVVTYDLDHDNRPDVWRLFKTEDEGGTKVEFMTCKQVDLDHDGKKDWVVAYNRKGTPISEREDLNHDGKWDVTKTYDTKLGTVAEAEKDINFDGTVDIKETYDTGGGLTAITRDRNNDHTPDLWEQYKDGILLSILYDDNFDGRVDRREEIPGAHPKVEMPTTLDPTASAPITDKPTPPPTK